MVLKGFAWKKCMMVSEGGQRDMFQGPASPNNRDFIQSRSMALGGFIDERCREVKLGNEHEIT